MAEVVCIEESIPSGFAFDPCNPTRVNGQVHKVYLTALSQTFPTGTTAAADYGTRMAALDTDASKIAVLHVIGSRSAPTEGAEQIFPGGRIFRGPKTYSLAIRIMDASQANHDAIRKAQAGSAIYKMEYQMLHSAVSFGGPEGIEATLNVDMDAPEDANGVLSYPGTLTWQERVMEPRRDHPTY